VYQHLRDGILRFLDCSSDHAAIARRVAQLVRECDVFVQGFRWGSFARRGFGPEELSRINPRLIYVEVNAYDFPGGSGASPRACSEEGSSDPIAL
jgi:crotonobetainyl-CoA:carnitine CoA-transferase CaiB-like acyl-CoA transferase